ncbi:hypothetical protein BS78_05G092700 [Paspalum vaginatum]|nr:hypothetical protein BS78_05G092700 [Paspalum vaginatum]
MNESWMDAHHVLDGMLPPGKRERAVPPVSGSGGSIESLPDEALQHVISFLLAPEAVRTSVLARRWRHLWKFATGLRLGYLGEKDEDNPAVKEHREFVDHLLLLRGGSPLDTCEFRFAEFDSDDEPRVNLWVRHAILCKVRVLRLHITLSDDRLVLDDLPLVSQHLTRLDLSSVRLHSTFLNLSSCPALEHLELVGCGLSTVKRISSESLKHLTLSDCVFDEHSRTCICTPSLVSLCLDEPWEMTPMLDTMPSLLEAYVQTVDDDSCMAGDICYRKMHDVDCGCRLCDSSEITDSSRRSVLLEGLSQAESLVLMSTPNKIIIKSDLRWCPIFGKLKTLLLNDCWCEPDDFNALACILEHSPVLEKNYFPWGLSLKWK